jgi:predicted  nucleic acid-binding Zn-ribbon protein
VWSDLEQKFERRLSEETGALANQISGLEQKFERRLSEEVGKLNERLTTELSKVNVEFARVRQEMAELKTDLIRWMFIFWVGQIGAIFGILFAFFRK